MTVAHHGFGMLETLESRNYWGRTVVGKLFIIRGESRQGRLTSSY